MKMFSLLIKNAPNKLFLAIILGMSSGIAYTTIIPMLLNAIGQDASSFKPAEATSWYFYSYEVSNYKFAMLFVGMCFFILLARVVAHIIQVRICIEVATEIRTGIYYRLINASINKLDEVGPAKVIVALTTDVSRVVSGAKMLPEILTTCTTLFGLLGYLYYLNSGVFEFVMWSILFGVITYQLPMLIAQRYIKKSRDHMDSLQESIRGLIYGMKELKLNGAKREDFFRNFLIANEVDVKESQKLGQSIMQVAGSYGSLLSFFIVGAVSFIVVNHTAISQTELLGVIMVLLYVTGPIQMILGFVPEFMTANVSLKKLDLLFDNLEPEFEVSSQQENSAIATWQSIRFENLEFVHSHPQQDMGFKLGPLNFEIRKGEITFIVGGNGSGKSTLSKLMSLHYHRSRGDIYFSDTQVTTDNINACRNEIAVIYPDYYLFTKLLGVCPESVKEKVQHYLEIFELTSKVKFDNGSFSSLSLSDGQRRRLALLASFVENKELYIFDEWAADQDPRFKKIFYEEILPAVKAKNKAVVVVSHDDRFFHMADHLIQMEDGQIVSDKIINNLKIAPEGINISEKKHMELLM